MGHKTFRDRFGGGYIVQKEKSGNIVIGSGFVHNLITVTPDFKILKNGIVSEDGEPYRIYLALVDAKQSGELERSLSCEETYSSLNDVYIPEDGRVIKKQCEEFGWPNTTIDGRIMYENTSFKTRREALSYLRRETFAGAKMTFILLVEVFQVTLFERLKTCYKYFSRAFRAWAMFGY